MLTEISRSLSTADLKLPLSELYRCMGYGDSTPEAELCQLCEDLLREACTIARPSFHYSVFDCEAQKLEVKITGEESTIFECGKTISALMRRSAKAVVFVATAGEDFQNWAEMKGAEGEILNTFIIDSIGSMMVESVGDYIEELLDEMLPAMGLRHTNRFSPGYCGWSITEQVKLFGALPIGVCSISLNESCLMNPIKSISGIIGVGEDVITKKYGCAICTKTDCYLRKK